MANMTILDGVNRVLIASGIRPVAALDTNGASEASDAERMLDHATRDAQIPGLYENRVMSVKHTAAGGVISLASNVIAIQAAGPTQHRNFTIRESAGVWQVFDLERNTFVFTNGEEIFLDLTVEVQFRNASPYAQDIIVKRAAQMFQRRFKGSPTADAMLSEELLRAEAGAPRASGRGESDRSDPPPFIAPRGQGGPQGG